ncbi:S9 family peptidase (plasmid) [Nicoliella spurrieriana]|uniref:S9 family peptidase n=1 Tax=Nicoliella spurrieriana TaxID=2925830 RepID=A0A976RQN5_9LACO|nr:S9 family peptidase [Nicoliella spurrieriana]UQS86035.1 S9 family peptidase [Nicoliella spurrieriana]
MQNGVQNQDLFTLKSVTQPVKGEHFYFFLENNVDQKSNAYQSNVVSLDSQHHYKQWTNGGLNLNPVVTKTDLVYLHQSADKTSVMKMPLDGGVAHSVYEHQTIQSMLLTGDQTTLFFKTVDSNVKTKYSTTAFPTSRHVTKLFNRADGVGWLPNDLRYRLVRLDLDSLTASTVFESKTNFNLNSVNDDGTLVAYTQQNHPEMTTDYDASMGVYLFNLANHETTFVTKDVPDGIFSDVEFAPDGQKLALVGNTNVHPMCTVNNLWRYDLKSHQLANVTGDDDEFDCGFAPGVGACLAADFVQHQSCKSVRWLDSDRCVVAAYHHGMSALLLNTGLKYESVYQDESEVYDFCVLDAHQLLLSVSKQEQPNELCRLSLSNQALTSLYNPNLEYEKDHEYAKHSHFTYRSTDDQVDLDGWVLHANHSDLSPVILYIHGGPHYAYGETFFHEFQTLANNGYSVVFVNPRGSTTYGQAFETDVVNHYGENDYLDLMAGLEYALANYSTLDAKNVFVAGGSYGGFMSSWMIGHTDRFKAACVQRPATDWHSFYGTSDIGFWFCRNQLGLDLFNDKDALAVYWDKSPLKYAHNVTTPVRIQHGEYDMRCPLNQSEALFTAVKQTGTDCDYVRYPQSFHGLSRNGLPNLRMQRIDDVLEWFNRYRN